MAITEENLLASSSEKTTVIWLHPRERILAGWKLESGTVYSITTIYFVNDVIEDGSSMTSVTSTPSSGEFFYDSTTSLLRVNTGADPRNSFVAVEYRQFYSDRPLNLPYDLSTGREVSYEGRLRRVPQFTAEIDSDDLTGISLAGKGRVSFNNKDGFFDSFFEKLFFETTSVEVITFINGDYVNNQTIFKGRIRSKAYSKTQVSFEIVDFIDELRNEVPLTEYTESDGSISDEMVGLPKRRIYGRVNGLRVRSLDQIKDGFNLTGNFAGTGTTVTATGGDILDQLSPGDTVSYLEDQDKIELTVETIAASGATFTVSSDIDKDFTGITLKNSPEIPYRKKNRTQFVAEHQIKEPTTTISVVTQLNRIDFTSVADFDADDLIFVNNVRSKIRRISGNSVTLENNLPTLPTVGQTVFKSSVQSVKIGSRELVLTRDYTVDNSGSSCKIVLDDEAEANISRPRTLLGTSLTFTNSSQTVTGIGTKFTTEIITRDWLKVDGTVVFYEVLSVESDTSLTLRIPFAESTATDLTKIRKPDYISDSTIITVNCLGKTENGIKTGKWIKTFSQIVKDLLKEQGLADELNLTSFSDSEIDTPYLPSLSLPVNFSSSEKPRVRDVIDICNKSVMGSIFLDSDYKINHSVLSPDKGTVDSTIKTDDIIGEPSISSNGKNIVRNTIVRYQHFDADQVTEESGSLFESKVNDFIDNISSVSRELDIDIYLYNQREAKFMVQRISLFREFSNSVLSVNMKLQLLTASVNTVIYFDIEGIPDRFGAESDQSRIGIVTKITKTGEGVSLEISDIGNMFLKVCNITTNSANIYTASSKIERATDGYITDAFGISDNEKDTNRTNLIG